MPLTIKILAHFIDEDLCQFQTSLPLAALPLWWWYFCIQLYVIRSPSERQSGERQASMVQTLESDIDIISFKLQDRMLKTAQLQHYFIIL